MSSNVSQHVIQASTHGRYLFRPSSKKKPPLLVGFHGYAETAVLQMERLQQIPFSDKWSLCTIEALHQFYRMKDNQVVSSWMTRFLRDQAIQNNVSYVNSIVQQLHAENDLSGTVVYLGFSQGVAMAYRTALSAGAAGIISLAGDLPPEIVSPNSGGVIPRVLLGRCLEDQWYTKQNLASDLKRLKLMGIVVETCSLECGHEWTTSFGHKCGDFLEKFID